MVWLVVIQPLLMRWLIVYNQGKAQKTLKKTFEENNGGVKELDKSIYFEFYWAIVHQILADSEICNEKLFKNSIC